MTKNRRRSGPFAISQRERAGVRENSPQLNPLNRLYSRQSGLRSLIGKPLHRFHIVEDAAGA